jgi:S-adenosylmethionine synthetase
MSQEPLFDDIEEGAPDSVPDSVPDAIMDAFIAQALNEVEEVSPLDLPKEPA